MDSTKAFNVIYSKAVVIIKKRIAESNKQRETSKACCGEVEKKMESNDITHMLRLEAESQPVVLGLREKNIITY
jgi:hypothetical protein